MSQIEAISFCSVRANVLYFPLRLFIKCITVPWPLQKTLMEEKYLNLRVIYLCQGKDCQPQPHHWLHCCC